MHERRCWKWTTWKISRVSWRWQQQWLLHQEQTDSVPSSINGMSTLDSQRQIFCDICLVSLCSGIVLVPCDHWCFWAMCADTASEWLSYRPVSTVNWRSYAWLSVITVVISDNCYCFKRFKIHPCHMIKQTAVTNYGQLVTALSNRC